MTTIKKARELYGIYDYVCDDNVERLIDMVKNNGIDWVKNNTQFLKRLFYKNW